MSEGKPQTVTREQVKKHNSDKDIWIILHGRAYDITEFQNDHPGGPDILHGYAGEDATVEFEETFHSVRARELLAKYFKGDVEGMEQTDYMVESKRTAASAASSKALFLVLPVLVVVLGLVYKFVLN